MTLRGLVHAHSSHSFDSLLPPVAYLAYARLAGLDFICLTDHNTIAGSLELKRLNRDPRLEVVIGAEYATERGDLIGLFLTHEIRERRWDDVAAAIRAQGGLVLLPHPHRNHRLDGVGFRDADLVEVFNGRSSPAENAASLRDVLASGAREIAGADAHTLWELVRPVTLVTLEGDKSLREQLLGAPRSFRTRASSRNLTRYSMIVKRARARLGMPGHR